MSTEPPGTATTDQPRTTVYHLEPQPQPHVRKVSIVENLHGHDNLGFESRSRKVSAVSDHADHGPARKKSILHHSHNWDNKENLGTGHSDHTYESRQYLEVNKPTNSHRTRKMGSVGNGHDNLGFESPRSRKVSTASEHAELGPVRKKSILHHNMQSNWDSLSASGISDSGKHSNGDARHKKSSVTESVHSRTRFSDVEEDDRSWWYTFCMKCRSEESHPSWQPHLWPKICPYPFCPTYRQFSRIVTIALIGSLSWCVLYAIVGDTAAPRGKLFQLMLLSICAYFGGWLVSLTTLPALIGMLFTGLLFQNVGVVNIDESFSEITKEFRNVALVIILIRAGLDLDPHALRRLKFTVIKLGIVPWIIEALIVTVMSHFLLGTTKKLPWNFSVVLGTIIAAVSPAVVVPCLFRLRTKGYGVAKGIPTLIIAVAGIDDALSVAIFGIIKSLMFATDMSLSMHILQGPLSILGGIGFGILWGVISNYVPEKHDPFVVPLRILLLGAGGMISVFGSELIGYGGAGPLGCVTAAFVSLYCWSRQGWEIEDNPATTAFEIFWMIFEPILFGVTGAQIKLGELDGDVVSIGLGILLTGVIIRILATTVIGIGCKLNLKEKIFVALSWMSKATVQAALGPLCMNEAQSEEEKAYGKTILMVCVLSIMLTAPTGAILITLSGPRLLTKTKFPVIPEGWRRSHRPSIRDISIIDEEEEEEEREEGEVERSGDTTNSSQKDHSKGDIP